MLRLRTLGGARLTRDPVPLSEAASQQRRIALLAAIATAGDRGISRDVLVGLLWPDSEPDRARHALSQWLFLMRRDLGVDELFLGTRSLRLNPERITADVAEFDAAIAARDDAAAAALYAGPFLEGFFLSEAPEFEQWLDRERDRRHREALRVVERLARAAEATDPSQSIVWWQRLVSLDLTSGPAATNLVRVLAASGDPVAALAQARRHEDALRRELEIGPSTEMAALVESVRTTLAAQGPARGAGGPPADPYVTVVRERLAARYVVDRLASRTSLTSVFDARASADLSPVTLKVFLPDLMARSNRELLVTRLRDAAVLQHPHIDTAVVDSIDGIVYMAAPGRVTRTLRERIEQDGVSTLEHAVAIARTIASTLAHAHAHGITHGDLTPRRISVIDVAAVRVADFGVMTAVTASLAGTPHDSAIALGTPAYMSPEMLAGEPIAADASDVYSLGCLLYHLIGGNPPHTGANARAIITNRLREPAASVRSVRAEVPDALDRLLTAMLARSPRERPTAAQVLQELSP